MDDILSTIETGGNTYAVSRLSAVKAFHLARKLGPLLIPVLPLITRLWEAAAIIGDAEAGEESGMKRVLEELAVYLPDALTVFSLMDMESADFILYTCLDCLTRKQDTGWARVRVNGALMFADIKLPALFQLSFEVIKVNLGDFIGTGLLKESAAGEAK